MIARMWRARTASAEATARYQQVFETEVAADLRAVEGFRGAYLLARSGTEIRTLTLFASMAAVRRFAGPAYERERVTPDARATLVDSDPLIRHFEVLHRS